LVKKTKTERDLRLREETAYHEAGHAVLAIHHRRPFIQVSIEPAKGSSGRIVKRWHPEAFRPDIDLNRQASARIEREVLVSMGGMTAEARFTGRKNYDAAESDIHQSIDLAS
jgi:ATP-dependent Zn protease